MPWWFVGPMSANNPALSQSAREGRGTHSGCTAKGWASPHLPSSSFRISVRPDTVMRAKNPSPETVSCSVINIGWFFRSMVGSVINIISLRLSIGV
jgi:hypothetical protein